MLIRPTMTPMMRVAMGGFSRAANRSLLQSSTKIAAFPFNRGTMSTRGLLSRSSSLHTSHHVFVSAACLTTKSNGPLIATSASQRSMDQRSRLTPFPLGSLHNNLGALACYSTSGGPPRGGGNRFGILGGMLGAGAMLMGKGKYLLGALKLTKFASLGSMVVSVGAYSMVFGLPYAAGMVGLILVHETGHALAMMHYGMPFSPMVFLPFMGAVIATKEAPRDAWQDAMIGIAGPALGTAGAFGVAVGAHVTESQLLYALADFGFMINLFNMLPLGSMDGGRIAGALSPWAGVVGLAGGATLISTVGIYNPIFYLIMLSGGWTTFQRFYDPLGHQPPNFYNISTTQKVILGTSYFGLIGTLLTGMAINQVNKKSPEEVKRYQELHFDEREF